VGKASCVLGERVGKLINDTNPSRKRGSGYMRYGAIARGEGKEGKSRKEGKVEKHKKRGGNILASQFMSSQRRMGKGKTAVWGRVRPWGREVHVFCIGKKRGERWGEGVIGFRRDGGKKVWVKWGGF